MFHIQSICFFFRVRNRNINCLICITGISINTICCGKFFSINRNSYCTVCIFCSDFKFNFFIDFSSQAADFLIIGICYFSVSKNIKSKSVIFFLFLFTEIHCNILICIYSDFISTIRSSYLVSVYFNRYFTVCIISFYIKFEAASCISCYISDSVSIFVCNTSITVNMERNRIS